MGTALSSIAGLGSLVCFILVIIQMFKRDKAGMAITCLVLLLCCVGGLVAFIYGWIKSGEWGITTIMIVWTVCIILSVIGNAMSPPDFSAFQGLPK